MILLDTNVVSLFLHPTARTRRPKAVARIEAEADFAIAFVTHYELKRGIDKLLFSGSGRAKAVRLQKVLDRATVLGLDAPGGGGWNLAAELWARGSVMKPAIRFSEGDLLIAATAAFHGRILLTGDRTLVENLGAIGWAGQVELLAAE